LKALMCLIACQITDADIPKEATTGDYIKTVLPLLLKNGVVHLLGFGNRLGFDPLPFELQVDKYPFFQDHYDITC